MTPFPPDSGNTPGSTRDIKPFGAEVPDVQPHGQVHFVAGSTQRFEEPGSHVDPSRSKEGTRYTAPAAD